MHVAHLRLAFSTLMFHPPSLLFPRGHFDTTIPSAPSSSSFTRPEGAGQGHFYISFEEFGCLADPTHSTGCEPKQPDKTTSVDGDTTPINDPDHDSISDFSVFPQCVKPLFRTALMVILLFGEKAKEACLGKPLQDKERKGKVLRSVLHSRCEGKVDGTVPGVILFRLRVNSILMHEISENTLNEELNKLFSVKIQPRGNYI